MFLNLDINRKKEEWFVNSESDIEKLKDLIYKLLILLKM